MPKSDLEMRFERQMREGIPALKQLGYNPTYFIRMMNERGAAQAIRDLINSPNESEGFTRLWEMKRLELSAEAIVADQPEWADLFTDEQRQKARRRLEGVGYQFQNRPFTAEQAGNPDTLPTGDERLKALAEITLRPHQTQFRESLRRRYGDACQISGCTVMAVVQACHLVPVSDKGTDQPENGVLLRVDLHVLFDADRIAINPETLTVHVASALKGTEYAQYEGKALRISPELPNRAALRARWESFVTNQI